MNTRLCFRLFVALLTMTVAFPIVNAFGACCQPPYRGNVDASPDGVVSLGDLSALIDLLFISLDPPHCWTEANLDGSLPEGPGSVSLGDLSAMIDHLYISMEPLSACPEETTPEGSLVGHGSCKYHDWHAKDDIPATQACVDWTYDGNGTLTIEHLNTCFNCCPVILAEVEVDNYEILVTQFDSVYINPPWGCDCWCLYDLTYVVTDVDPSFYTIRIIEPYRYDVDPEFNFTVNLMTEPTGRVCLPRSDYPWEVYPMPEN